MRKLSIFVLGALCSCAFLNCGGAVYTPVSADSKLNTVFVGGMSAGFTLKAGGVQIVGTCEVMTDTGVCAPAAKSGLRAGDKIVKVAGISVETITELNEIIEKNKEKEVIVDITRNGTAMQVRLSPVKDKLNKKYKIGILARDSVSGIGTVTYINPENGRFAALGHSVVGENKKELAISDGKVYECNIIGVSKGVRGRAGELRGAFLSDKNFGNADKLCTCGIFGQINTDFSYNGLQKVVADSSTVLPGVAYIYSTINGTIPERYEIEIVKVDKNNRENKNFVVKISDETLLEETGGIVQGMSGSPILQNGKMVGAITHVFLNDPTRGYGIDITKMLNE